MDYIAVHRRGTLEMLPAGDMHPMLDREMLAALILAAPQG